MDQNKLILGTVQFGLRYGVNNTKGQPSTDEVSQILNQAYLEGISCLDTAEAYGNAHEIIGKFHQDNPHTHFDIITKLPHHLDENLVQKIDKYLAQLQVNKLYGLLFHSYDTYKQNKTAVSTLINLKEKGLVDKIGVSIYNNVQMEDVIEDDHIDIIQLPFNLLDNLNLREKYLQLAKDSGKIIHTRSAFLQGLFFLDLESNHHIVMSLKKELSILQEICKDYQISIQKLALNYCTQQNLIDNVLIGVETIDQLNQNLADLNYQLPADAIKKVNEIFVENVDLLNPSLWN